MEERIAIIGIIVENLDCSREVNEILHQYGAYIEGRMGLPKVKENISLISVVMKAPQKEISAMTGKLGMLDQVSCKAVYSKNL